MQILPAEHLPTHGFTVEPFAGGEPGDAAGPFAVGHYVGHDGPDNMASEHGIALGFAGEGVAQYALLPVITWSRMGLKSGHLQGLDGELSVAVDILTASSRGTIDLPSAPDGVIQPKFREAGRTGLTELVSGSHRLLVAETSLVLPFAMRRAKRAQLAAANVAHVLNQVLAAEIG